MRFVCDFDGIAYPFITGLSTHPSLGELSIAGCHVWELPILMAGADWDEAHAHALTYETMRLIGLYEDFVPAIESLRAQGVEPIVMTHRSAEGFRDACRILQEAGLDWLEVHRASPEEKIAFCLAEGVQVIVDDHPGTIAAAHAAGLQPMTLRFPYNDAVIAEHGVINAESWTELEALLVAELRKHALLAG